MEGKRLSAADIVENHFLCHTRARGALATRNRHGYSSFSVIARLHRSMTVWGVKGYISKDI